MKSKLRQIVSAAVTITVMALIFGFSSRDAGLSKADSTAVTRLICRIIFFGYGSMSAENKIFVVSALQPFVRKLAHFSVYMLLGFFSCGAMLSADTVKRQRWGSALFFCFCCAALDEIHQYFIPGRAMQFTDVLIDTCGSAAGMLILRVLILPARDAVRQIKEKGRSKSNDSF